MENWQELRLKKIAKIAAKHCENNERVLDIGCMNRHILNYLPETTKIKNYVGLDVNGDCDVKYDLNTGELPFSDNEFDFVIAGEIFEHILKPKDILKEIKRVLKKDGYAVFSIPNENHVIIRLRHLFNRPYAGFVFDRNPQKHLHSPRLCDGINFIDSEFKIINKQFYTPKPKLIWLSKMIPSLFARGTIFEVKNEK